MDELQQLRLLAGITNRPMMQAYQGYPGSNISLTGTEKAEIQRENKIRPGTDAWFRLWFAKPYLTGETPI
jgi:hypothetical protein